MQRTVAESRYIEIGLERVDLTAEGVAGTVMSMASKQRWSSRPSRIWRPSRIIPAHVPNAGIPASSRSATGSNSPQTRAASTWSSTRRPAAQGRRRRRDQAARQATGSTPSRDSMVECRADAPCRASTPTFTWGPRCLAHDGFDCTGQSPATRIEHRLGLWGSSTGTRPTTGGSPCTPRPRQAAELERPHDRHERRPSCGLFGRGAGPGRRRLCREHQRILRRRRPHVRARRAPPSPTRSPWPTWPTCWPPPPRANRGSSWDRSTTRSRAPPWRPRGRRTTVAAGSGRT